MKTIEVSNVILDDLEMSSHINNIGCYKEYFPLKSGQEHYRLLRYLSSEIGTHIIEIGTHCGTSAYALSIDNPYDIITYDIVNMKVNNMPNVKNIKFKIQEFMDDLNGKDLILSSKMIFIDAPHNGDYEIKCYNWLIENNYRGIAVWDDIHLNADMKRFWENVTHNKIDLTKYGHATGTGVINFSDDIKLSLL